MSKNVAVFVDVANIFYAAKAAGVDIDYVTLLKAGSAGRDLVRAYAYTGLDPDNENQRNFHDFLRRHGYKVVSKDIRKYGDGKVKANLDIELVVDMMKTARNLDIAIVVSGDGDFAPAIRAVQEMGVRVEVVSFRGNTSSDLIDVADQFTDITQIAKVEKGSTRSGRRVADDDEDLSMTEVPEKQSEGLGDSRRGRGRGRTRTGETPREVGREPARTATGRTRRVAAEPARDGADVPVVVLPGEKLSRVAARPADDLEDEAPAGIEPGDAETEELTEGGLAADGDEAGRRRRRRRGGRGRGRGRREEGAAEGGAESAPVARTERPDRTERAPIEDEEDEFVEPVQPRRVASTFGSVWDSQIGVPAASTRPAAGTPDPFVDDEDLDEPPIPEYLIAERRQQGAARGRIVRGGRGGAYAAAMERERFGGGRGAQVSRFAEPAPRRDGGRGDGGRGEGGRNRFDRPDRDRGGFRPEGRPEGRPENRPAPRPASSEEPWSEVPPELEAMLRAQLASGGGRSGGSPRPAPRQSERIAPAGPEGSDASGTEVVADVAAAAPARRPARRGSRATASSEAAGSSPSSDAAVAAGEPAASTGAASEPTAAAPRRRSRSTASSVTPPAEAPAGEPAPKTAARRTASRTTRTKAADAATGGDAATTADVTPEAPAAPKRRTRRTAEPAS